MLRLLSLAIAFVTALSSGQLLGLMLAPDCSSPNFDDCADGSTKNPFTGRLNCPATCNSGNDLCGTDQLDWGAYKDVWCECNPNGDGLFPDNCQMMEKWTKNAGEPVSWTFDSCRCVEVNECSCMSPPKSCALTMANTCSCQ